MRAELLRAAAGRRRGGAAPVRPAWPSTGSGAASRRRRGSRSSATGCCGRSRRTPWSPSCWPGCWPSGDRGGLAEQVARQTVRGAAGRVPGRGRGRGAPADRGGEGPRTRSRRTPSGRWPTRSTSCARQAADLAELRRAVHPLARRLAARLTARAPARRARAGWTSATVRASLATGGVPLVTHHRPRKAAQARAGRALRRQRLGGRLRHFTLMLDPGAARAVHRRAGLRVRRHAPTRSPASSGPAPTSSTRSRGSAREADVVGFDGHSDYGTRVRGVRRAVAATRSGRRRRCWSSATRAPTTGRPGLPVLADLVRRSRSAHWLNPEPRRQWGSGDSAADRYGEVIDMVECRNAAQLADFVTTL